MSGTRHVLTTIDYNLAEFKARSRHSLLVKYLKKYLERDSSVEGVFYNKILMVNVGTT